MNANASCDRRAPIAKKAVHRKRSMAIVLSDLIILDGLRVRPATCCAAASRGAPADFGATMSMAGMLEDGIRVNCNEVEGE